MHGNSMNNREDLGKRVIGYMVYNSGSKDFIGMTENRSRTVSKAVCLCMVLYLVRMVLNLIKKDFILRIMVKTGISTPPALIMTHDEYFYIVIGSHTDEKPNDDEVVSRDTEERRSPSRS